MRGRARASKGSSQQFDYESHGAGPAPTAPAALVWIDEPGWMAAIHNVLHNRVRDVKNTVENRVDYGVDVGIVKRLRRLKFDVGGDFKSESAD
jgi:hypothetical protein